MNNFTQCLDYKHWNENGRRETGLEKK